MIGEIKAKGMSFDVTTCTKTVYNIIAAGFFLNITNEDLPVKKGEKKRDYKKVRKVALNNTKGRSIEERPATITERKEQGHWEMDHDKRMNPHPKPRCFREGIAGKWSAQRNDTY